jgi:hypothetical protein
MEGEQKIENQIKTFDAKLETKALNKISKLLREASDFFSEEEILKMEDVFALDRMNVFAIIAKTTEAKLFLRRFISKRGYNGDLVRSLMNINYVCNNEEAVSSYDAKLLEKLLGFMQLFETVKIKIKKDQPIWLENEHFIIVLAPRIMEE